MVSTFIDNTDVPPFETEDLRRRLAAFLNSPFAPDHGDPMKVGDYKWGVYAFFDYDGEPIYVGQTNEKLRTRIRRHLTNQRTDAVAMSVLDPFEVLEIEVWPLADLQLTSGADSLGKERLNALERVITKRSVDASEFKAILNEKDAPLGSMTIEPPKSLRGRIVSDRVYEIRSHPDFRIARRAQVIARLAQVISERKVQTGLRRVLLTQAKRLQWLASRRFQGSSPVEVEIDLDLDLD
ncbi:MAG: GIY-YIG nuclease family protein [Pseudomonadota bacterium]